MNSNLAMPNMLTPNEAAYRLEFSAHMRKMEIPGFPRKIEIPDLHNFIRTRLSQTAVMWPEQAIQLLGYMCYPNDAEAREDFVLTLRGWPETSEDAPPTIPGKLGWIRKDWLRVADILHLLCDLAEGRHQARRGGPSVGKAITLVEVKGLRRFSHFCVSARRSAPLFGKFRIYPALIGIFFTVDRGNVWWIFIQVRSPNPKFLAVGVDPLPHAFA